MATREEVVTEITQSQIKRLVHSLASMRNVEEADVTLVCEKNEFQAHKLVLKASCPYFSGMFQSNMKETESDKIVIHQVEPEALGAILDYLYTGKVPEIDNASFLIKLTEAAHLFQLMELFNYCCSNLVMWLSNENYDKLFNIAVLYDLKEVLNTVMDHIINHIDCIIDDTKFLNFSNDVLREFLHIASENRQIMEELLLGIVNWICHDLQTRQSFTSELLQFINVKCLRREFMKFIIDCEALKDFSAVLADQLKELAVDVFYELSENYYVGPGIPRHDMDSENCNGTNLLFFGEHRVVLSFEVDLKRFVKRDIPYSCIQQLDLGNMNWYPVRKLPFSGFSGSAMCQHKGYIYMVGGDLEHNYAMYNVAKNVVRFVPCNHFNGQKGGILLPLHDHIYYVDKKCNITQISPGKDVCMQFYFTINPTWKNPRVFATTNWMYVSYFDSTNPDKALEITRFSDVNGSVRYQTLTPIPDVTPGMTVDFAVSSNSSVIYGFYQKNGCLVRARNRNAQVEYWEIEEFPLGMMTSYEICAVYKTSPLGQNVVVLVTGKENSGGIPNYLLDPETCKLMKLPPPKWKCEIPEKERERRVYFIEDL